MRFPDRVRSGGATPTAPGPIVAPRADQRPGIALTFAEYDRAYRLAGADRVAMVFSDQRLTGSGWRPLAIVGWPRLIPDTDGTLFTETLLDQELRKFPPSRALADSALLRREHWWYLPRLIITLEVETVEPIRPRVGGPDDALLSVWRGGEFELSCPTAAEVARITDPDAPSDGHGGEPAVIFGHDVSADLEQQVSWATYGKVCGGAFRVSDQDGVPRTASALTLWLRLTRQRELSRGCRLRLRRIR